MNKKSTRKLIERNDIAVTQRKHFYFNFIIIVRIELFILSFLCQKFKEKNK